MEKKQLLDLLNEAMERLQKNDIGNAEICIATAIVVLEHEPYRPKYNDMAEAFLDYFDEEE
jgi:hypothetical protein